MKEMFMESGALRIAAVIALVLVMGWILMALFRPHQPYRLQTHDLSIESQEFRRILEGVSDAQLQDGNSIEVFTNGENYYPAELEAIKNAKSSVHIEAFIFKEGEIAQKFVDALAERARAGVKVRVIADAVGSAGTSKEYFKTMTDAGGEIQWYHPVRWHTWDKVNNRTHRELIIIDGASAFIGGSGVADHWWKDSKDGARWRDNMFLIKGPSVNSLQSTFSENWLEASGDLLTLPEYFPAQPQPGQATAMAVNSAPSQGRSTRARMLFQTVLGSAKKTIYINSPYFLPDASIRRELVDAVKRGVQVKVITPGKQSDQTITRSSSRRLYGEMLEAGIEIYEYHPAMIHVKGLIVDGRWAVVGTTNFDNRSFELNDEVNLAIYDGGVTDRLSGDFNRDLEKSKKVSLAEWKKRPLKERFTEFFGRIIERQQ